MSRIVVKFGGTSVGSGERIKRAAESVAKEFNEGNEVAVVVSAMGDTTDYLLDELSEIGEVDDTDESEILGMGERTSARMFKAALQNLGVDSFFVEPGDEAWPIVTDEAGKLDESRTDERADDLVERLGDAVPVVCGFLGQTPDGTVTTLGRGGSDTTAMILGNCLGADEVVIVTDVEGIMTGDPRIVDEPESVDTITVDEMQDLSIRGAQVIAPSALNYKRGDMNVRIVHHKHGDLHATGTVIEGEGDHTHVVESPEERLAAVTVAGRSIIETPNLLSRMSTVLGEHDINIYGHSTGSDSMTFFVAEDEGDRAKRLLHDEVVTDSKFSSVSMLDNIAMVLVSGGDFIDTPGIVYHVVKPLYEHNINIIEIISSVTGIVLFVDWEDGDDAFELVKQVFDEREEGRAIPGDD